MKEQFVITEITRVIMVGKDEYTEPKISFSHVLDNNELIQEFQAGFEELLYFVNVYFANEKIGNFENEKVDVIFNPDVLINESETIDNINKSTDLSLETRVKMHPYVKDAEEELKRIKKERQEAMQQQDPYRNAFENQKNNAKGNEGGEPVNEE